ncbi:MAG: hypothetical protein WAZ98_02430 [Cyclobacteriaceae bacterium]
MKRVIKFWVVAMVLGTQAATAQQVDQDRMDRDLAVAENVLSTLLRQEFEKRGFFPMEVQGSYRAGYGVTFTIPTDYLPIFWGDENMVVLDGAPGAYSYSFSMTDDEMDPEDEIELKREMEKASKEMERANEEMERATKELKRSQEEMKRSAKEMERADQERRKTERSHQRMTVSAPRVTAMGKPSDSLRKVYNTRIITAAKNFLTDYGDMMSQLAPDEKIIITNQGGGQRWYFNQSEKRSLLSVEATRNDLTQFRQGKITRDQLLAKIKVTNTESSGKVEPDLELLTSIFNRLYRSDLSKNFFIQGQAYYERLNDFGAIVYMQVYSSNQVDDGLFNMPTISLRGVTQDERDKKVKELYPVFEKELKENILEYGRTVKSLKDQEQLVFNVTLTRCKGCGIPSDIEVTVKSSVLSDYNAGKVDKKSALEKIAVKRGASQ